jgi:hypothetical protein
MSNFPPQISLSTIATGFNEIMSPAQTDPLILISPINLQDYNKMRKVVNNAFDVGSIEKYSDFIEEETEFGDVTTLVLDFLEEFYPKEKIKGKAHTIMLSIEERIELRDQLIQELDDMVKM